MSNPLFEPIHGVSLFDHAAISAKMASGADVKEICKTLGIEQAVFEEASTLWNARMQEDGTFEVITKFGEYFGQADQHPKLGTMKNEVSEEGESNIEKMKSDRYFYEELNGARVAAYEYGYDGAQWILDNFGISLGDFQKVATHWQKEINEDMSSGNHDKISHFADYQQEMQKKYAAQFAAEQGGNIADDVEF